MKSDIEIAREAKMMPIDQVAEKIGIPSDRLENYGKYKAKLSADFLSSIKNNPDGKLILVTAINPTPAGEGKTTTSVGLADAFNRLGKKTMLALREPSLGPCFGVKGGAAGGGYSQVVPMDDINLHFTGDFHAITSANNILAAVIDNHIYQGNELRIDSRQILWKRCEDMNDRALRNIVCGLGNKTDGFVREDHFIITVASEIMAILCLANDLKDLKDRLSNIIVAYNLDGEPVTAGQLKCVGAMTALLKDAIRPNLVQTLENSPVFVHGGPFANIAHGCNSVIATKAALKLSDYTITEAGFGADLGAEKFLDIKCPMAGLRPSAVVLVATVRALKYNGGVPKSELNQENVEAMVKGSSNLVKHIENLKKYNLPIVVAINSFYTDTDNEINELKKICDNLKVDFSVSEVFVKGGEGALDLAQKLINIVDNSSDSFKSLYDYDCSVNSKIETVAKEIYGADGVNISGPIQKKIDKIEAMGFGRLPICVAKTQYSLSDNPTLLGAPSDFRITIRDVYVSAGAGFIVVLTGDIMTMPGLPKVPAAYSIDVDDEGNIVGLF